MKVKAGSQNFAWMVQRIHKSITVSYKTVLNLASQIFVISPAQQLHTAKQEKLQWNSKEFIFK